MKKMLKAGADQIFGVNCNDIKKQFDILSFYIYTVNCGYSHDYRYFM